ncbi:2-keto-4-pentenoate hydratase [Mycobacterium kyorinense]|nr:fumarylacetoacetate hydrolase family protein [Mycobacterium kyorinense]
MLDVRKRAAATRRVAIGGYKAGPDQGPLMTGMFVDDGDTVNLCGLCHPRIEVELAFVLGDDLPGQACTELDVLDATEYVVPSIELITDAIADNASSARVVLGSQPCSPLAVDLADLGAVLSSGYSEVVVTRGNTGAVLGNPLTAVARLARHVAQFGVRLQAGHTILPGSCTRAVDVSAGDRYRAEFAGVGGVSVEFC